MTFKVQTGKPTEMGIYAVYYDGEDIPSDCLFWLQCTVGRETEPDRWIRKLDRRHQNITAFFGPLPMATNNPASATKKAPPKPVLEYDL